MLTGPPVKRSGERSNDDGERAKRRRPGGGAESSEEGALGGRPADGPHEVGELQHAGHLGAPLGLRRRALVLCLPPGLCHLVLRLLHRLGPLLLQLPLVLVEPGAGLLDLVALPAVDDDLLALEAVVDLGDLGDLPRGFVSSTSASSPIRPISSSPFARLASAEAALAEAAAATMAENSLLMLGKGSLGAVSLPTERIDVCLLPHESLLPARLRRYDCGARGGLSAWMSLNSGSSSSSSSSITRCGRSLLVLLLPLAAGCPLNMWCRASPPPARSYQTSLRR